MAGIRAKYEQIKRESVAEAVRRHPEKSDRMIAAGRVRKFKSGIKATV